MDLRASDDSSDEGDAVAASAQRTGKRARTMSGAAVRVPDARGGALAPGPALTAHGAALDSDAMGASAAARRAANALFARAIRAPAASPTLGDDEGGVGSDFAVRVGAAGAGAGAGCAEMAAYTAPAYASYGQPPPATAVATAGTTLSTSALAVLDKRTLRDLGYDVHGAALPVASYDDEEWNGGGSGRTADAPRVITVSGRDMRGATWEASAIAVAEAATARAAAAANAVPQKARVWSAATGEAVTSSSISRMARGKNQISSLAASASALAAKRMEDDRTAAVLAAQARFAGGGVGGSGHW